MKLNFATLDVFTTKRFAGNSLGVVFDADGIDGATMQIIAREFNHPETVFVLKPEAARQHGGRAHLYARQGNAVRRPSDRRHRVGADAAPRCRQRRRA